MHGPIVRQIFAKAEVLRDYERGKRVEVRLWSTHLDQVFQGQTLHICSGNGRITRRVVRKNHYQGYEELVRAEKFSDIFPGVVDERTFRQRIERFYPVEELRKKCLLVFELDLLVLV